MSERWQHTTITLTLGVDPDTVTTTATVEADVLGALAVHRTAPFASWTRAKWSVTHVPTGRHVATANTERLARQFVRSVLPLTDWSNTTSLQGLGEAFWTPMYQAMLRAHNGQYVNEVRLG